MLRTITVFAALTLAASGCQPPIGPHAIQTADTREVWIHVPAHDAERGGFYRCYDNGGKPQCVKAEFVAVLSPSPSFCAVHPQ